ncbi:MAG: hypothetical protein LBJ47_11585, partial [Tannerella sp.]|nr:hypothetical protein [Tannerella sp.]
MYWIIFKRRKTGQEFTRHCSFFTVFIGQRSLPETSLLQSDFCLSNRKIVAVTYGNPVAGFAVIWICN